MRELFGVGVSDGIAIAKIRLTGRRTEKATETSAAFVDTDPDKEWNRFLLARDEVKKQLGALAEKARSEIGDDAALLFETHQMMAEDPDFEDGVALRVRERGCSADVASEEAGEELAEMLAGTEDDYLRARASDVRDVSGRIAAALRGEKPEAFSPDEPVILAAKDLSPGETVRLDKSMLRGIVLFAGSANGHTAILARTLGIPAIIRAEESAFADCDGAVAVIDGKSGRILLDPDPETLRNAARALEEQEKAKKELEAYRTRETVTKGGRKIKLYCSVGSPDEVEAVLENGGEGIGLFRSEFLYLKSRDYPTEDEQAEAYGKALAGMGGREVIIRTCDIGSDKWVDYFELPKEENPALGFRAIRICLARPAFFKTQLRALLRASVKGRLSVMFPMISSLWEWREARALAEEAKAELRIEGIPFDEAVRFGVTVETPAAVLISAELAKEAQFFSIGTNDLTQYTLGCDRNGDLKRHFDPHHPAVLELIRMTAESAGKAGIDVGVCGELGADETLTDFFLGAGITELSVSPKKVLALRKRICEMD